MRLTKCTYEEYKTFLENYPRPLERDVSGISDPPILQYNDFTLGIWPESVVAACYMDDRLAKDGEYRSVPFGDGIRKEKGWRIAGFVAP